MSIPRSLTVLSQVNILLPILKYGFLEKVGLPTGNGLKLVRICLYFIEIEPVYQYVAFTLH